MAIDGIKKELNEIFPHGKKLNETDLQNEVLLAEIYCFRYITDQAAFSDLIINYPLDKIKGAITRNFNEKFDSHYDVERLKERFKDPKRNEYLVSNLGPNSLLTYALNVIRDKDKQLASKIEKKLEYIKIWQNKNNILDEILKYNSLPYSGNRGDIDAKIKKMLSRDSVSVKNSDYNGLLDLGLNLSSELQEKFKIIRDNSLPPSAAAAAGGIVSPSRPSSSAAAAIDNIFEAFGIYKYDDYSQRISGLIEELFSIQEISKMDVKSEKIYIINLLDLDAIRSDDRFGSITGILDSLLKITDGPIKLENAQVFKTDTIGAAGGRVSPSGQGPSPVAAGAAGGRVSPSGPSQFDELTPPKLIGDFGGGSVLPPVAGNVVTENEIKKAYYDILRGFMPYSYPNRDFLVLDFQEISIYNYELLTSKLIDDYYRGSLGDDQLFSAHDSGALLKKDENGHTVFSDEFNKNLEILNNPGHTENGKNFSDLARNMIRDASQKSIGAAGSASTVAAGAAGGRVLTSDAGNTEKSNREAIAALREIAGLLGVDVVQDDTQLLDDFLYKILERKSFQISAENRKAYENALDVLRQDKKFEVVLVVLNQSDKIQYDDSLGAAGAGAAAGAAGANSGQGPSAVAAGVAGGRVSPSGRSSSPVAGNVVTENEIKTKIDAYIKELNEGSRAPGQDQAFKNNLISFLEAAKDRIKDEPPLLKKLDLFFKSADESGGFLSLACAIQSKKTNSQVARDIGGKKVKLGVDCIESRLMDKVVSNSFNYVIGAKTIGLQKEVKGNFVLVDPNDRSANESYAPYAVPDDDDFLKVDTQKSLYKLNLLDGISQMAQAISDGKTDIRVTCVEGRGRSVTLAFLFAKICQGDFALDHNHKLGDEELINMLARDRNSGYNYVTTGSQKSCDYNQSVKFQMLKEFIGEFGKKLKGEKAIESIKQVADDMIKKIQGELTTPSAKSIVSRYANQPEMKRAPVIGP